MQGGAGSEEEAGPSRRPAAAQRSRRRPRAEMEEEGGAAGHAEQAEGRQSKRQRRARGAGGRALSNYSWLLATRPTSAVYVPQAGDCVVYLREGHERYLQDTNDKRPPPWATLRHGRSIRPAEPCRWAWGRRGPDARGHLLFAILCCAGAKRLLRAVPLCGSPSLTRPCAHAASSRPASPWLQVGGCAVRDCQRRYRLHRGPADPHVHAGRLPAQGRPRSRSSASARPRLPAPASTAAQSRVVALVLTLPHTLPCPVLPRPGPAWSALFVHLQCTHTCRSATHISSSASCLQDTCFAVEVPPPVANCVEYVVLASRFQASVVSQCWEVGQRCQVVRGRPACGCHTRQLPPAAAGAQAPLQLPQHTYASHPNTHFMVLPPAAVLE